MINLSFPLHHTFIALPLEGEAKRRFQALQESVGEFDDILVFQNPKTPHLTFMYWKEMMEIEYGQLLANAQRIASRSSLFNLPVTGVDTFANHGKHSVLFLTVGFSEELAQLKKLCPWPNEKPFVPHITLARIRHPQKFMVQRKKILKRLDARFTMHVDRLRLYAEVNGAEQTPLRDFPFHP